MTPAARRHLRRIEKKRGKQKEVMIKIVLFASIFKKNRDGATKPLYELTDSLPESGIEVAVWGCTDLPVPLPLHYANNLQYCTVGNT